MSTKYNSSFNETYPTSDQNAQFALAANTELTYTVPGASKDQYQAQFSWPYDANVWFAKNNTATLPTPGTMNSSAKVERNPKNIYVSGGDVLHFISTDVVTDAGIKLLLLP